MRGRTTTSRHPGFTIVELLLALVVSAIVLSSVPVMISLSTRAAPTGGGVQNAAAQASGCLAQLGADLQLAREVTELSGSAITMSVPARDGSGAAQVIRYAWGGTPGDPIVLSVDGAEARLVTAADAFSISGVTKSGAVYTAHKIGKTGGVTHQSLSGLTLSRGINNPGGLVQVTNAPTGSGLQAWTVTSVSVYLSCSSPIAGESVVVSIVPLNADRSPAGGAYYRTWIASTDLKSSFKEFVITAPPMWIPAGEPAGIMLTTTSTSLNASAGVCLSAALYSGGPLYSASADAGPWSAVAGFALVHGASGSVLTASGGATARTSLERLDVSITTGDAGGVFATSLYPLNPILTP